MRCTILSFAALGVVLAVPAFAQTSTTTPTYAVPMYVSPNGTQPYGTQTGTVPMYNAQPLPMEQLIAGKNAPSYNYNNQAYTGFNSGSANPLSGVTSIGSLSPEQMQYVQQQQAAQALAYQNEYLASLQGQPQAQAMMPQAATNSSKYQGSAFSNLYTSNEKKKPTKRKVIYKEMNNPLQTPPRLFNPDQ